MEEEVLRRDCGVFQVYRDERQDVRSLLVSVEPVLLFFIHNEINRRTGQSDPKVSVPDIEIKT